MPSKRLVVTLECAGNGRTLFNPPIEGEKWNLGAVSTAEWIGVPLMEVLDRAGIGQRRRGSVPRRGWWRHDGQSDPIRFERSLSIDQARDADALLAYAMNGEPLPIQHGYPLRLIVPSWYAVASVKWLTEIELIDRPFVGYYQTEKYCYEWSRDGQIVREPVTLQKVRALITDPSPQQVAPCGEFTIRGIAWSGAAPVARVEVSVGDGAWQDARLVSERKRHSWQWWEMTARIHEPGNNCLARPRYRPGGSRPTRRRRVESARLGNNSIHRVSVRIE